MGDSFCKIKFSYFYYSFSGGRGPLYPEDGVFTSDNVGDCPDWTHFQLIDCIVEGAGGGGGGRCFSVF